MDLALPLPCIGKRLRRIVGAWAAASALVAPGIAQAAGPSDQMAEIEGQAQAAAIAVHGPAPEGSPPSGKADILAVPLPITSPVLGTGIVVAGIAFYNPNGAPSPWISGAAAMKTSNGNWLLGGFHSMSLDDDRVRISGLVGTGKLVSSYYGIGPDAGDRDVSVKLDERFTAIRFQGQMRVADNLYAGARFLFADVNAEQREPDAAYPDMLLLPSQLDSRVVQIGPVVTYDTRDDTLTPRSGVYASGMWLLGLDLLGGDFRSNHLNLRASWYLPQGARRVLALHGAVCGSSTGAPYYGLCLFGQGSDLRGYKTGRYRDRASWAVQAELRQHISGRWGAVAFAGLGGIAPGLGHLGDSRLLPSAGAGLRFRPSRQTNINLRLDFAVGRDSNAIYLGISEAF